MGREGSVGSEAPSCLGIYAGCGGRERCVLPPSGPQDGERTGERRSSARPPPPNLDAAAPQAELTLSHFKLSRYALTSARSRVAPPKACPQPLNAKSAAATAFFAPNTVHLFSAPREQRAGAPHPLHSRPARAIDYLCAPPELSLLPPRRPKKKHACSRSCLRRHRLPHARCPVRSRAAGSGRP